MGEDEHPVGVAEVALVLLHLLAGQRPVELSGETRLHHLRQRDVGQLREVGPQCRRAASVFGPERAEQVHQHAAGVAHSVEHLRQVALAGIFNDDRGGRQQVGLDVGVDPFRVGGRHRGAGIVETAGEGLALDQELDLDAGAEHGVQQPTHEFGLADGQAPHRGDSVFVGGSIGDNPRL